MKDMEKSQTDLSFVYNITCFLPLIMSNRAQFDKFVVKSFSRTYRTKEGSSTAAASVSGGF